MLSITKCRENKQQHRWYEQPNIELPYEVLTHICLIKQFKMWSNKAAECRLIWSVSRVIRSQGWLHPLPQIAQRMALIISLSCHDNKKEIIFPWFFLFWKLLPTEIVEDITIYRIQPIKNQQQISIPNRVNIYTNMEIWNLVQNYMN